MLIYRIGVENTLTKNYIYLKIQLIQLVRFIEMPGFPGNLLYSRESVSKTLYCLVLINPVHYPLASKPQTGDGS